MAGRIYFDNAATTPLEPKVFETMMPFFNEHFGNPSSIYSYGRETRLAIESARKSVAKILHAHPSEIFFTSGGTESTNTAILGAIHELGCKRIITSPIEHHATLHTCHFLAQKEGLELEYVSIEKNGEINYSDLEQKLYASDKKSLVSLMHANNEIGNITDIASVGKLCRSYGAVFHADTVQTVGHYPIDLSTIDVDFITASAHKFHGPKGVGILYINSRNRIHPFIHGGGQERNMRAGTENIYGIVGLAKALEIATEDYEKDSVHIASIRSYMKQKLMQNIPGVVFNGGSDSNCLYAVLSVGFPKTDKTEMLMFNLDVGNICVSGGSACSSGADQGSHVIKALQLPDQVTIRFSFSKFNTNDEVDRTIDHLLKLL